MADRVKEEALKLRKAMDAVYEAGKQAEYDRFWNIIQQNGERTDYYYFFNGFAWTNETFKPKYDLKPVNHNDASYMFRYCGIVDLRPSAIGVNIDLSKATNTNYALAYLETTKYVGIIDLSSANYRAYTFYSSTALESIEKIITRTDIRPTTDFGNTCFQACKELQHVVFEGNIWTNISFQWSTKLTLESAKSIILALKNYAGTDNEYAYTVTFANETWAILNAAGATSPNSNSWSDYVNDLGWNAQ